MCGSWLLQKVFSRERLPAESYCSSSPQHTASPEQFESLASMPSLKESNLFQESRRLRKENFDIILTIPY